MNVVIYNRNFVAELAPLPVALKAELYSHAAIGGPKQATISATIQAEESDIGLWGLVERLRCPVEIWSDKGDCVWWGYIAEISLELGAIKIGVSIDSFSNRIAVAYSAVRSFAVIPLVSQGTGTRGTTAWAEDADSILEYGYKELLMTTSGSTAGHAAFARDMLLAQKRFPLPVISWEKGENQSERKAILTCRGWFETLGWRYYSKTEITEEVDTAGQVAAIATAAGQFIVSVDQDVVSGIATSQYRDGDASALYEATELLKMGTANNRRMLARVDSARRLRIYEEPTSSDPYFLLRDGSLNNPFDVPLRKDICPVACWARVRDVIPQTVDVSKLSDPTLVFIEENEYDVAADSLQPLPRGIESAWDLARMRDG